MPSAPSPEDVQPRPSPFGAGMVRRRAGRQEWHVSPDVANEMVGPDGVRLAEWVAAGAAAVVKTGPHRTVYRVSLPSGVYFLKHYKLAGPRAWFQNNLRPCRAYREAAASARVREAGIATAEPVAVGRVTTGPFSRDSFFVSREIPGVAPLDECLATGSASAALRRDLAGRLAGLTAALHRHGLFHADYHAGNVLVRGDGDAPGLWLIDLHPLRPARMTAALRHAMLGMLATSFAPHATRSDRRRFFAAYSAALEAGEDARAVESACGAEVRLRQDRADRKWRRGNRRVLILDANGIACRGLADLGKETLVRLRGEALRSEDAARRGSRPPGPSVRRVPTAGAAREAWEVGHALLRRGFPAPRPLLFVSDRSGGAVVIDGVRDGVRLGERRTSHFGADPGEAAAALGRLMRRLHDVGFDAAPDAFVVTADGDVRLDGIENVARRRMSAARRRDGVVRVLARLSEKDGEVVLRHYGGSTGFERGVRRRLAATTRRENRPSPWLRAAAALLLAVVSLAGCRTLDKPPPQVTLRPEKHSVRAENLVLISDFKLPKDDPLVADLVTLRRDVMATLRLPEPRRDVNVYLFSNEEAYRKYLDAAHPGLPPRRAYFVGTKDELAVYTYWGDRVLEDLRHESTHGVLHASLAAVPLWLDEGLAEYFEVPGREPGAMNGDYPQQLAVAVSRGWRPDIERLERIEEFSQLRRIDYQESWAWVHYLLHATPDTRAALLAYVGDLRDAAHPSALAERVAAVEPSYAARFLGYVATLNSTGGAVIRAASTEF